MNYDPFNMPSEPKKPCPHGYRRFCPFCTPTEKTAETSGLPLSTSRDSDPTMVLPILGLAIAVAAAIGVLIWLL